MFRFSTPFRIFDIFRTPQGDSTGGGGTPPTTGVHIGPFVKQDIGVHIGPFVRQ